MPGGTPAIDAKHQDLAMVVEMVVVDMVEEVGEVEEEVGGEVEVEAEVEGVVTGEVEVEEVVMTGKMLSVV